MFRDNAKESLSPREIIHLIFAYFDDSLFRIYGVCVCSYKPSEMSSFQMERRGSCELPCAVSHSPTQTEAQMLLDNGEPNRQILNDVLQPTKNHLDFPGDPVG